MKIQSPQQRILITDDEESIRDNLSEYFLDQGYIVDIACDAGTTISQVEGNDYNVLLLDDMLPDDTGLGILPGLLESRPSLSVIVMTGYPTVDTIITAVRRGACDVVVKPFVLCELIAAVERAVLRNRRLGGEELRENETVHTDSVPVAATGHSSATQAASQVEK